MKSSVTKTFRKRLNQLPTSVQEQAEKAYELWREDPYHNSLQFKPVSQRQPIYSARISLNYRVLGLLESGNHIYWFWIGAHDEYDDLLKRL
jgi:mRNA-degrading endonuclease RelE of RelBE toxin-antitoxin system